LLSLLRLFTVWRFLAPLKGFFAFFAFASARDLLPQAEQPLET
jgi:hypothetical protein